MLTFLGAFSIECFATTNDSALWISIAVWILVAFLVIWVIYSAWESSSEPVYKRVLHAFIHGVERVRQKNRELIKRVLCLPGLDNPC